MTARHAPLPRLALLLCCALGACGTSFYAQGSARFDAGDYPGALEQLARAIEEDPTNLGAVFRRGLAYARMRLFDEAIADYETALVLEPAFAEGWYQLGVAHASQGDHEDAVAAFDRALMSLDSIVRDVRGDPLPTDAALIYYDRGLSLYRVDRFEDAIDSFDRALVVTPRFANAYNSRGAVHARLGDKQAACRDRKAACELGLRVACEWAEQHCPSEDAPADS